MSRQKLYISNQLHTSRQIKSIQFLRKAIASGNLASFISWTKINPLQSLIDGKKKISAYSDFTYLPLGAPISLSTEIVYSLMQIVGNIKTLNKFLEFELQLEDLLLRKDYSKCRQVLNKIDIDFGLSLWSLDIRLSVEFLDGRELGDLANFRRIQQRVSKSANGGFISNYSYHRRIALEYDAVVGSIQQSILNRLRQYNMTTDAFEYFSYRLANIYPKDINKVSSILYNENRASIIDIFTTMRDMILHYGDHFEIICNESLQEYGILDEFFGERSISDIFFPNLNFENIFDYGLDESIISIVDGSASDVAEKFGRRQLEFPRTIVDGYYEYLIRYVSDAIPGTVSNRQASSRYAVAQAVFSCLRSDNIDPSDKKIIKKAFFSKSNKERLDYLSYDILNKSFPFYKHLILENLDRDEHIEAIGLASEFAIVDGIQPKYLPIHETIRKLQADIDGCRYGTIESLIVCHLEYKLRPSSDSYRRVQMELDCFLTNSDVEYPSQIDLSNFPVEYSEYFFRDICDLNIIDSWYMLDTNEKLISERIKCLKRLIEVSPSLAKETQNEIINFSTRVRTREIMDSINKSKLRIDKRLLVDVLAPKLELDFERMLSKITPEIYEYAEKRLAEVFRTRSVSGNFEKIEKDDLYSLLNYIVSTIAEQYLTNEQIGLDHSLGTRIRHNIFLDELSSTLRRHALYLKKNDVDRKKILSFWSNYITDSENDFAVELINLTSDINKTINDFKEKYIRVKSDKYKDGAFFLDIDTNICIGILGLVDKDQTFPEFIDTCIQVFSNSQLNKRVIRMRQLIENELEISIKNRLSLFRRRANIKNLSEVELLFRDVEIGINKSIAEVKRWFSLENSIALQEKYTPEDTFNVAKEVLKNIDIEPQNPSDSKLPDFEYTYHLHEILVYSLVILIDNSVKYSDEDWHDLSITQDNSAVKLRFRNSLKNQAAKEKLDTHWHKITKEDGSTSEDRPAEKDTGSGLARILTFTKFSENSSFTYHWEDGMAIFDLTISINFVDDVLEILEASA